MNRKKKIEDLRVYEDRVAQELREAQSVQTFGGTLKINLDRVYVDQKDGRRALDELRRLTRNKLTHVAG
jgi:hypothetical protein